MNKSTKNTLRLISIIIVLVLVLMELNIITAVAVTLNLKFWLMVAAYAVTLITLK